MTYPDPSEPHVITGEPWYVTADATTDTVVSECRTSYSRALEFWGTRLVTQHGAARFSDVEIWDREPTADEHSQHGAGRVVQGSITTYWPPGISPRSDEFTGP